MDINKAFKLLMVQEGISLTNMRNDRGGLTKYGIAQASHPTLDIAKLTEPEALTIYAGEYWGPAKCSALKSELQYMHFSCAVNCGVASANKILQRATRVPVDGIIGDKTLQAAQAISIQDYAIEWAAHYKAIIDADPSQVVFQKGWTNRINTIIQWSEAGQLG